MAGPGIFIWGYDAGAWGTVFSPLASLGRSRPLELPASYATYYGMTDS